MLFAGSLCLVVSAIMSLGGFILLMMNLKTRNLTTSEEAREYSDRQASLSAKAMFSGFVLQAIAIWILACVG